MRGKNQIIMPQKATRDLLIIKIGFGFNVRSLNILNTMFMPISFTNSLDYALPDLIIHSDRFLGENSSQCDKIQMINSYEYLGIVFN